MVAAKRAGSSSLSRSLIAILWVATMLGGQLPVGTLPAVVVTGAVARAEAGRAEATILLHSFESADRLSPSWGSACTEKAVTINSDPRFVSHGKGSLHLSGRSGAKESVNFYNGVLIPLEGVDVRDRAAQFDCWTSTPEATQAVYLRLYGPEKKQVAGWVNWNSPFSGVSHRRVRLNQEMAGSGFTWERRDVPFDNPSPVVAAEIIIGTRTPNTLFDIFIDNLRVSETPQKRFAAVEKPKKLYRQTPLVRGRGGEAVIVAPAGDEFGRLARHLREKIKELFGAELPIVAADDATREQLAKTSTILLGNVCNNRAILPLYATMFTPVDDAYPPDDGYLVHTVHDPWGTGKNALVIGASSLAGTEKAVEAFLKTLTPGDDLVLPKLNLFELSTAEMKAIARRQETLGDEAIDHEIERAKRDFARGGHRSVAGRMASYGFEYARTGDDLLARLYKELVLAWYESYQAKPGIYGGPWGMDMDFHLKEILPAWDLLEESPALTDEDRRRVTEVLFEFITTDVVRKAAGALRSTHVRHNHMTFPALGLYFAGEYFRKGYGCVEAEHWLEIAEACFTLQAKAAKPYEDCNGYGWLVPYHTMRYGLAAGDTTCFDNGTVRRQADYAILTMDNLGYQVPYGDTGSWQCWFSEIPFLRGALFFHRDGRYAWVLDKKLDVHSDNSQYEYACRHPEGTRPKEPVDLLGTTAIPLDRMYWETFDGPDTIALEKTVDKVVMRSSFDPGRQYLLLDGLSNGGHRHFDGNSISRITDRGRIWLADNDYVRSLPKFHNSMLVFKAGQAQTIPPYCELEALADGRDQGISQTVVRGYTGVDWHRAILWGKDRFFLVVDELVAQEPDEYDFHCLWHTVGNTVLTDRGLQVDQKGPRFFIRNDHTARMSVTHDYQLGENWRGYPFAEPVVHSLRQVKSARLAAGERISFANLLFASDEARRQDFSLAMLDPQTVVIGGDVLMIGGVGEAQAPRRLVPGLQLGARAFLLGENSGLAVDVQSLAWGTFSLSSPQPLWVEVSKDRLHLTATTPAAVTLAGAEGEPTFSGTVGRSDLKDGRWTVQLLPGRASVALPGIGLAGLGEALKAAKIASATPPHATADDRQPSGEVIWSAHPKSADTHAAKPDEKFTVLAAGDLDGDGLDEIVAGTDKNRVCCLGPDATVRWEFAATGPVTTTAIAGLDSAKRKYAIAGSEDCHVYALTSSGQLKWSFELPTYKRPGHVRVLLAADLDNDGRDEVVAGGDNWRYYALGPDGDELWHCESVHPSSAAAAADLDGDGKLETLCGTVYYWWPCVGPDGAARWRYSVRGPCATVALSANLEGGTRRAAIFGSADGNLHVLDHDGKRLWISNVGDEVTAALAMDLNGDGRDEIVASSLSFNVFALDATGMPVWRTNLDSPVRWLVAADVDGDGRREVAAACDNGRIVVLSAEGESVADFRAGAAARQLAVAKLKPGAKDQIVARLSDGSLIALQW